MGIESILFHTAPAPSHLNNLSVRTRSPVKLVWLARAWMGWGWVWICVCSWAWGGLCGAGEVNRVWGVKEFGPGEPWLGDCAWIGGGGLRLGCDCSIMVCLTPGVCWAEAGFWATWARGDCWKVVDWKVLSGVEELRVIGGPRRASRWGVLLTMEEVDGGVALGFGGAAGAMGWAKLVSSWEGVSPEYGGLSNSPPNSISGLVMSCSMSEAEEKHGPKLPTQKDNEMYAE